MSTALVQTDSLSLYMAEVNRFALLSKEEEQALAMRLRDHDDSEAARRLITANLRFVVKIAYEYRAYGLNLVDLIQEGNVGLMKAVKKFNPSRGYRLISYAVWWIRAYIQAFILRSWSLVKIGTTQSQRKLFYKLNKTKRLMSDQGEAPELADVARELNVSLADAQEMELRLAARDFALDQPVSEGARAMHIELLEDAAASQEEVYIAHERQAHLEDVAAGAIATLSAKEQFIVRERWMADEPKTLQEIGDHFGISRERARQIEANAKKKLRKIAETVPALSATGSLAP